MGIYALRQFCLRYRRLSFCIFKMSHSEDLKVSEQLPPLIQIEGNVEPVQVYLRVKPCESPSNIYEVRSDKCFVTTLLDTTSGSHSRRENYVSKMYTFTRIFKPECNQEEIFEQVVKDNLKKLVDGHSFTLLTYGASGSGKTHTVIGTVDAPGLVPRSLEYLFELVDAAQMPVYKPRNSSVQHLALDKQHAELQVSFVEIYNENIYDLLSPHDKRTNLHIRDDGSGGVYVHGVSQTFVRSAAEAYEVMVVGKQNLVVAATGVHKQSSRSHCIFTITMLTENGGKIRSSQVRLCDLAGCERQKTAENRGARMQESCAINSSLLVLERCLHMVRRMQRSASCPCVPFRESKLTRLLGAGLSGARGEALSFVVTLNPADKYVNITKHVLSLASTAKDIQVTKNTTLSSLESIQESTISLNDEVMRLRSESEELQLQSMNTIAKAQETALTKLDETKGAIVSYNETLSLIMQRQQALIEKERRCMVEEHASKLREKEDIIAKLRRELEEKEACIQALKRSRNDTVSETSDTKDVSLAARPEQNQVRAICSDSSDSDDALDSLNPIHRRTFGAIMRDASVISNCLQRNYEEKENSSDTEEQLS